MRKNSIDPTESQQKSEDEEAVVKVMDALNQAGKTLVTVVKAARASSLWRSSMNNSHMRTFARKGDSAL